MRAILLAAGYGTRLRPLTNSIPKCLVPIKGAALLDIWIRRLHDAGVGPFLVNTHYLAEEVRRHVSRSWYCDKVALVHEHALSGTAGTMIANADFYDGKDGLLIHADNYCMADFRDFLAAHSRRPKECDITMMTFRTDTPMLCGIVTLDHRGIVVDMHEKSTSPPGNLANGAIYALSSRAIAEIRSTLCKVTDFSTEVIPHFLGRIYSCETTATFIDIGSPQAYALACNGGT